MIRVTLKEQQQVLECPEGTTPLDLLQRCDEGDRDVIAARVDGTLVDLTRPLYKDCEVTWVRVQSPEGLEVLRHSTSHLMAQAVKSLYPQVQVTIGPAIEDGYYYDFDYGGTFTPEDLARIENRMRELVQVDLPVTRIEMSREEAIRLFEEMGEHYKVEILQEIPEDRVSLYRQGDFIDLCRGPHVPSTGYLRPFKLLHTSGAYWRGDERNKMLQRIYGTAFPSQEELERFLNRLEEIRKRDHRRLGRELDLFSIQEEIGAGLVLWHPKGALVRKIIEDFWREEHLRRGYELLYTPHLARLDLWRTSGHLDYYRQNMYAPIPVEEIQYQVKPMNCPFHIAIYRTRRRSYRELPIRWAELGTVYRLERSGVLHGLLRVRGFTQDDAHIFCRPDQLEAEILEILSFTVELLSTFGFTEYEVYLSTRPGKYVGSLEDWDQATAALEQALKARGMAYQVDPGEGVFYGPKIDIKIRDALDRTWQCSTIQVDFNLPQRFDLVYVGEDGQFHRPIMIHRALMGSLERFFGILIEHYAGAFPVWLAPVQARVLNITDAQREYGEEVVRVLKEAGIRAEGDFRNEKLGLKIREGRLARIPYLLVVGNRERECRAVSVRRRGGEDLGTLELSQVVSLIQEDIRARR